MTIWDDPLRHAACLMCASSVPLPAADYLTVHVLPVLRLCPSASEWQLLALLNAAAQYISVDPTILDPTLPASLSLLGDVVAAAAACPSASATTDQALLALLGAVLLPDAAPGSLRARPPDAAAVVQLLSLLDARALARQDRCTFHGLAYATRRLALQVQRVAKDQIPVVLELHLSIAGSAHVSVALPPAVAEAVGLAVEGDTVDIVQYAIAGLEGLPTAVFMLAFRCRQPFHTRLQCR